MPRVFAHIVTFNSAAYISRCLAALLAQDLELEAHVTDNCSLDETKSALQGWEGKVGVTYNTENLGFCGAHNQGAFRFLKSEAAYFLIVNPDLVFAPHALRNLVREIEAKPGAGMACPRLLRADESLNALLPERVDAAGMVMTSSLRHFDRGAEQPTAAFLESTWVFGGSGACLLLTRACVQSLLLEAGPTGALFTLYPSLAPQREQRAPLFDEAFFAYREDADLAWRAQLLGIGCWYSASSVAYHKRVVTPERRSVLPEVINKMGVRNRFLLQVNNYFATASAASARSFMVGLLLRNLMVLGAVLLKERSSLPAINECMALLPRAIARRAALKKKTTARSRRAALDWFT